MQNIELIGGSAAAVVAAGTYMRWAVRPALISYQLGAMTSRRVARMAYRVGWAAGIRHAEARRRHRAGRAGTR